MARGMLPPGHPLFFPRARGQALGQADLILVVGVPLDFRLNFGQSPVFADDAKIVYVDVDDHRKHRPAEVSILGDVKAVRTRSSWGAGPSHHRATPGCEHWTTMRRTT